MRTRRRLRYTCLAGLLALGLGTAAVQAQQTLYRWVDDQGNVHFSDKPQGRAEALDIRSKPTDPARVQQELTARAEVAGEEAETRAAAAEQAAEDRRVAEERENVRVENCTRAREALSQLHTARRPHRVGEDGEMHFLSSEQIEAERDQARRAVEEFCD